MFQQPAPQNTFGICEDCPPTSDLGLTLYHAELPVLLIVVLVSLIAGLKLSKENRLLPLVTLVAVGALFFQIYNSTIYFEKQFNSRYVLNEAGSSVKSRSEYIADFEAIEERYSGIFTNGWLAYSVLPFVFGFTTAAVQRRRRARLATLDDA